MKSKRRHIFLAAGVILSTLLASPHPAVSLKNGRPEAKPCSSVGLEIMNPNTLQALSFRERIKWYERKLSPCAGELRESARRHNIPTQLLSAIILNELADINIFDVGQEWLGVLRGSVGIAQIQIDTAIFHDLVDVSEGEIEEYRNSAESDDKKKPPREKAIRAIVGRKLRQPEVAIEAVAREIKKILESIKTCPNGAWRNSFLVNGVNLDSRDPNRIYRVIKGETRREKSVNLARMIAAPYNSSGIECVRNPGNPFSPEDGGPFANPRRRGESAAFIAEDVFRGNLFE